MIDDFVPVIHRLDGRDIRIFPVADVHIGAAGADVDGFASLLKKIEADQDAYIIICGDILDNGTKDSVGDVYGDKLSPSQALDLAVELFTPVKDRILGAVSGNHELRSKRQVDIDPLHTMMSILRIGELFRQNALFMRVVLEKNGMHDSYSFLAVHGKTENKKKNLVMATEGIDCVISGHTHSGSLQKQSHVVLTNRNRVVVRDILNVTASSWLPWGGYAARSLLQPTPTSDPCSIICPFTGSNSSTGRLRVDW